MKLNYDRDKNIAYLRLRPKGEEAETIHISDELNIDIAPDGSVYGIELLNANEQLRSADGGNLVLVDEVGRLGTEIAALFEGIGLQEGEEIPELRGYTIKNVFQEEE